MWLLSSRPKYQAQRMSKSHQGRHLLWAGELGYYSGRLYHGSSCWEKEESTHGPSSAPPQRYPLVQNVHLKFFRRNLSKGDGFSGLHCSRIILYPLLLSKMAQGRVLHHPFVWAAPTIALIVGIWITVLVNALRSGILIRTKAPVKTKRTRAKSRLFK